MLLCRVPATWKAVFLCVGLASMSNHCLFLAVHKRHSKIALCVCVCVCAASSPELLARVEEHKAGHSFAGGNANLAGTLHEQQEGQAKSRRYTYLQASDESNSRCSYSCQKSSSCRLHAEIRRDCINANESHVNVRQCLGIEVLGRGL